MKSKLIGFTAAILSLLFTVGLVSAATVNVISNTNGGTIDVITDTGSVTDMFHLATSGVGSLNQQTTTGSNYYGVTTQMTRTASYNGGGVINMDAVNKPGWATPGELNVNAISSGTGFLTQSNQWQRGAGDNEGFSAVSMTGGGSVSTMTFRAVGSGFPGSEAGAGIMVSSNDSAWIQAKTWKIGSDPAVHAIGFGDQYYMQFPDTHYGDSSLYAGAIGSGFATFQAQEIKSVYGSPYIEVHAESLADGIFTRTDLSANPGTGNILQVHQFSNSFNFGGSLLVH